MGHVPDVSPRLGIQANSGPDVPLANPVYLSDSAAFVLRQRSRAARALVSEHVGTVTCNCLLCRRAARDRVQPELSLPWLQATQAARIAVTQDVEDPGERPSTAGSICSSTALGLRRAKEKKVSTYPPQTAVRIDEARKHIRWAREEQAQPAQRPETEQEAKQWREAAIRSHSCLARLRAAEQELAQLTSNPVGKGSLDELNDAFAEKQQELADADAEAQAAREELERLGPDSDIEEAARLAAERAGVALQPRGFVWLLKVAAACAPVETNADPLDTHSDVRAYTRLSTSSFRTEGVSLEAQLGVRIPDTVILHKGKPQRRFSLDSQGRVQVTPMKSSAELLRVLKEFAKRATRPRTSASGHGVRASTPATRRPTAKRMPKSQSTGTIKRLGSAPTLTWEDDGRGTGMAASPVAEVAVLHYRMEGMEEGWYTPLPYEERPRSSQQTRSVEARGPVRSPTVRLMTYAEAMAQMQGVGKLPHDFWEEIRLLQVPVQSATIGATTRYILYDFNSGSVHNIEPQEQVPRGQLLSGPSSQTRNVGLRSREEALRVAAVPQRLNDWLFRSRRGQNYHTLVRGRFEFILDEADGALWLVHASRLFLERRREVPDPPPPAEEVRYFAEEEFAQLMRQEELRLSQNIKRFVNPDAGGADGMPTFTLNAADRLGGARIPQELSKYYEAGNFMLQHYAESKAAEAKSQEPAGSGGRAVGLQVWFRRWAKGAGRRQPRHRQALAGAAAAHSGT